jgi:hypothetical protein
VIGRGTVRARGPLDVIARLAAGPTGHRLSQPISTGTLTSDPHPIWEPS